MSKPVAGWYQDPEDGTRQRRWDGQQWTHETRSTSQARPWWKRWWGITLIVLTGLVIMGRLSALSGDPVINSEPEPQAEAEPAAATPEAEPEPEEEPEPEPTFTPDPGAVFNGQCDYVLGDQTDSPDTGRRFVAGGRVENTGNVTVRVMVNVEWEQLGTGPVTASDEVVVPIDGSERVAITVPATRDQISLHQSARGECNIVDVTIVEAIEP